VPLGARGAEAIEEVESKVARWVGAGGNGMKQGLWNKRKEDALKKQKAAWRPRRLFAMMVLN
jgi:hypothetical protein